MKVEAWQLTQRQGLSLDVKEKMSKERIKAFYEQFEGKVYVCFSGGKDSVVLLHLVRSMYPDVEYACVGTEPPENMELVRKTPNGKILMPKIPMHEVIDKHGYPILSKEISKNISRYRHTKSEVMKHKYLNGDDKGKMCMIPKKWQYLIDAPFKISEMCCPICKKTPLKKFEKESGKKPIEGIMTYESRKRKLDYLKNGCNVFEGKNIKSTPIAFWTEQDIWDYIKKYNLEYSKWYDLGYKRSGCFQCLFGIQHEAEPNRIQRMQLTHPKQYQYCIDVLHYDMVLSYLKIPYKLKEVTAECKEDSHDDGFPPNNKLLGIQPTIL